MNYPIHVFARHFVNDEPSLGVLEKHVEKLGTAVTLAIETGHPLSFGLKLTADEDHMTSDLVSRTREQLLKLPHDTGIIYDQEDRGPGTSYQQILFNPTPRTDIVIGLDLDQYVVDTVEAQQRLIALAARVRQDNTLYACGSRDVPVVLSSDPEASKLREIHELFHSSVIGDSIVVPVSIGSPSASYASIGESTSGCFLINHGHAAYPKLVDAVETARQSADMDGFATDYFVALAAAKFWGLENISSGYVSAVANTYGASSVVEGRAADKAQASRKLISAQTRELGKTEIGPHLLEEMSFLEHATRLNEFYDSRLVEEVRDIMLGALRSSRT